MKDFVVQKSSSTIKFKYDSELKNISYLSHDEMIELANRLGWDINDRSKCSFFCRCYMSCNKYKIKVGDDWIEQDNYQVELRYGKFGTCRECCKRLIRPDEFEYGNFEIQNRIGFGSNGEVFKVIHKATQQKNLALKIMKCQDESEMKLIREKYQKIVKQQNNEHSVFIAEFLGLTSLVDNVKIDIGIIMPKYDYNLLDHMKENNYNISENIAFKVAFSVLNALVYLHSLNQPIIHGSIKPSNIFGSKDHTGDINWLLGEFNPISHIKNVNSTFLAPEQLVNYKLTTMKTDIWCLGVTLFWILSGLEIPKIPHLFIHDPEYKKTVKKYTNSSKLNRLISAMLRADCHERPSASKALKRIEIIADKNSISLSNCRCTQATRNNIITTYERMYP